MSGISNEEDDALMRSRTAQPSTAHLYPMNTHYTVPAVRSLHYTAVGLPLRIASMTVVLSS